MKKIAKYTNSIIPVKPNADRAKTAAVDVEIEAIMLVML